jgi:hypothetical protein
MMTGRLQAHQQPDEHVQLARLLACHYGDGTVYLPSGVPRQLLETSIELGYVSPDGFITREGRLLVARSAAA